MRWRVVLDANVIVSGILGADRQHSRPRDVLQRCLAGAIDLVISPYILDEADDVVGRAWFVRRELTDPARGVIANLAASATVVSLSADIPRLCRDPKDDAVIATAVAGNADVLVTGDDDLLALGDVAGVRILDPAAFVALLDAEDSGSPSPAG